MSSQLLAHVTPSAVVRLNLAVDPGEQAGWAAIRVGHNPVGRNPGERPGPGWTPVRAAAIQVGRSEWAPVQMGRLGQ